MTWFKVDDGFHDHPKVLGLDLSAVGLWTLAGAYCARHLTDGVVSDRQIRAVGGTRKQAQKLVDAGLWSVHRDDADAPPSARRYVFNDWADFQPTRADVTTKRREDAERKRAARSPKRRHDPPEPPDQQKDEIVRTDTPRTVRPDVQPDSSHARPRGQAPAPASRPDPTRPDLTVGDVEGGPYGLYGADTPPPPGPDPAHTPPDPGTEPATRCPKHLQTLDPPACRACQAARERHEEWTRHARHHRAAAASTAARERAALRAAAVAACDLCDPDGYRHGRVCNHDPGEDARNAAGAAAVRHALATSRVRSSTP